MNKNVIKRNIQLILIYAISIFFYAVPKVHADFDLGVYPPLTTITTDAPYEVNAPILLHNNGETPLDLDIQIKPFVPSSDNNGTLTYLKAFDGPDAQIKDKISLQMENEDVITVNVPPKADRTLSLHVNIPENEPDGEYYFSVIFISKGQESNQDVSSGVSGGIATNVILHVGNPAKPIGAITDFSTSLFQTSGPIPINLLVTNTGNTFFAPHGTIIVKNTFGQTVGAFELLPVNILKSSSRYIPVKSTAETPTQTQIIWNEKVLAGIYSIELKMKLSDDGPFFDQTIYFFVLPWAAIIAIIGLSLLTLAVVLKVRRRIGS